MKSKNFNSKEELIKNSATLITEKLKKSLSRNETAHLAVSGGSTPLALFEYLKEHCEASLSWGKVHFWWVDERFVPHTDVENNFHNAMKAGLNEIPANFHEL
jgi:6-phosphogluconolactonase